MRELGGWRWLFINFLEREIRGRYIGTATGLFWALVHPIALLGVYYAVFGLVFKAQIKGLEQYGFITLVAMGIWPWLAFQEGVTRGMLSVQGGAALIKKVAFPHELLVYSAVLGPAIVHGAGFLLVLFAIRISGIPIHLEGIPILLFLLLTILLLTLAATLLLSAIQVFSRDLEQLMVPVMMVWFYATPILYTSDMVPEKFRAFIALNPMTYFIGRIRDVTIQGAGWLATDALALGVVILAYACSRWFFLRLSPHFEDYL